MNSRLVHTIAMLLLAAAAVLGLVFWIFRGWDQSPEFGFVSYLPEFPTGALLALFIASAVAVLQLFFGMQLVPLLSRQSRRFLPSLAFGFLAALAISGLALGWLAFLLVGSLLAALPPIIGLIVSILLRRKGTGIPRPARADILWLVPTPFLLLVGLAALAPAVESDGLRYHLVAPQEWLRAGRFVLVPYSANSNLPSLQSLFAADIAGTIELGRVYQVIHFLLFATLVVMAGELARMILRQVLAHGRERSAMPASCAEVYITATVGILVVGCPAAAIIAAWPFSDVAACAWFVAGIWALTPGTLRHKPCRLLFSSLFLGAAIATRISLLPIVGIVGLYALYVALEDKRRRASLVACTILPGLLMIAPWLIKNQVHHGNPVYPLAYSVFGGPEWSPENDAFYKAKLAEKGTGHGLADLVMSPVSMTDSWGQYFESFNPGPALLALLPAVFLGAIVFFRRLRGIPAVCLVVIACGWIVWFRSYQSVRFFLPLLLLIIVLGTALMMALAARLGRSFVYLTSGMLAILGLAGAVWAPVYHIGVSRAYDAALGRIGEQYYINRRFDSHDVYTAILWLNGNMRYRGEPVYYIGEHRAAYADMYRPITSDWFDTPRVLVDIRRTPDNDALIGLWREEKIRYVLLNLGELAQYEQAYFRPRFSDEEWRRFENLRTRLLENIVFETGKGVYVVRLPDAVDQP